MSLSDVTSMETCQRMMQEMEKRMEKRLKEHTTEKEMNELFRKFIVMMKACINSKGQLNVNDIIEG
jgi:uncharacterized membrane protein (DUF106 family)